MRQPEQKWRRIAWLSVAVVGAWFFARAQHPWASEPVERVFQFLGDVAILVWVFRPYGGWKAWTVGRGMDDAEA